MCTLSDEQLEVLATIIEPVKAGKRFDRFQSLLKCFNVSHDNATARLEFAKLESKIGSRPKKAPSPVPRVVSYLNLCNALIPIMFSPPQNPFYNNFLRSAFMVNTVSQAYASELSVHIPSRVLHLRAISNSLKHVRLHICHVLDALQHSYDWDDSRRDGIAYSLCIASVFLGGALDSCVIASLPEAGDIKPSSSMSFHNTPMADPSLFAIQQHVNSLRSYAKPDQAVVADLWCLIRFWKHHFPYQPVSSMFSCGRRTPVCDFSVHLADGCASGPVMRDLIIPGFNGACQVLDILLAHNSTPDSESYAVSLLPM